MEVSKEIAQILEQIRERKPLIHHLTNYVTANDCANIALAVGASPVMASDPDEAAEMAAKAAALVINIGTLSAQGVEAMVTAGKRAVDLDIPVVFDPVGVGVTHLRTNAAERIMREVRPLVIRGNMSEIKILAGHNVSIRGVDATADETDAEIIASSLSQKLGAVIGITGQTDIIAYGHNICRIYNGHSLLSSVTGTGCMATTLVGCCCSVTKDPFMATIAGIAVMGIAGELAQQSLAQVEGIGTFRMRLFDAVFNMTPDTVLHYGKISVN